MFIFEPKLKQFFVKKLEVNPKAKALIFDLDGTLADTMPVHFWAYKNILTGYGIEFTPELFGTLAGIPATGTINKLNEMFDTEMDPEAVGHYKELEYEKIMHKMKPVKPVVELALEYSGKLPMAVGTGGHRRLAWKTLEILGLKNHFEILVATEDVENAKPHPETFLKCAEQLKVAPEYCQVFEDGELGVQAATSAGMMSTLVTDFYEVSIGRPID